MFKGKKAELLIKIKREQKVIFKGCASRELYACNLKAMEHIRKEEKFAWLDAAAEKSEQKKIISRLHEKVAELEKHVKDDINSKMFERGTVNE